MSLKQRFVNAAVPWAKGVPGVNRMCHTLRYAFLEEPEDTPLGFKFSGNPSMVQGTFETEEVRIAEKILPGADVFINIGANLGYYCCIALRHNKKIIAFEPMETNLKYLYRNLMSNAGGSDAEVFPLALGNRSGLIEIFGAGTGASLVEGWAGNPLTFRTIVPLSTLDTVLGDRFTGKRCFFIIDIEGAEADMLSGAKLSLGLQPKPVWMVEISIKDHWPEGIRINPRLLETFGIFWENGYEAWTADKEMRPVGKEEIAAIVETGTDTLLTYNFLFMEKGKKKEIFGA